jgi:stage II sporulation protein D
VADRIPAAGPRTVRLLLAALLLAGGIAAGALAGAGRGAVSASTSTGAVTTTTATTTTSTARDVLVVSGHGWGHGLGLSQWGAYGYALHGWTYDRILAHYYTGTTLGAAPVSTVRVLVDQGKSTTIGGSAAWTIVDATGAKQAMAAGSSAALGPAPTVNGAALTPPLAISSAQPLTVDGRAYRGRLTVLAAAKQVQVVDVVGVEAYVKGVVPAEMPSGWPAAALQAQAVAARSYALARLHKTAAFDLYGDTRDQAYGGVAAETPAASAAVDATRGKVVLSGGKVADTLYFSTSGGRTADAAVATGHAVPYLVSVADPYDTASPYHDWGPVLVDAARLQKLLVLAGPVQSVATTLGRDGRVASAVVAGAFGRQSTITGAQLRDDLGLRSTWATIGQLTLAATTRPVTYGGSATLSGIVRGVSSVSLEARVGSGPWLPAGPVTPDASGAFAVLVKPAATTRYRLAAGTVRASQSTLGVAPAVTATVAGGTATGSIVPAAAGAAVQLQENGDGAAWQTVGTATTDAAGGFSVTSASTPTGALRVRVAPGHGLVPGFSKTVPCC